MRILLVDDEPMVLASLARMLRQIEPQASVTPATSGRAALDLLRSERFDVLITDMQMPVVSGEEVLARARETNPATVRVLLSGYADLKAGFRSVSLAHQYLAKPCSIPELREMLSRAAATRATLGQEDLIEAVAGIGALPPAPRLYARLLQVLASSDGSLLAVAEVIEEDDALTAKVLQVANSAFFGAVQEVRTASHAVACLGLNALKALVLTCGAFQAFPTVVHCPGFDREKHQTHAFLTGGVAGAMGRTGPEREELFTLGVLHDIGKLALAARLPGRYAPVLRLAAETARPTHEVEAELGLPSHASVGAALLSLWGLPAGIVQAVRGHHAVSQFAASGWSPAAALHVADALAHEQAIVAGIEGPGGLPPLDVGLLQQLGVLGQLAEWRAVAHAEALRLAANG
jgi:HD-like signal output (HDOD) protein/CheY-like chemotaxis protein